MSDNVQRVVIDTDPGVDDAQAILFALRLATLRIDAVTTIFGNCDVATATRNARTLLELGQAADIPVFKGASESLIGRRCEFAPVVHGRYGFGSFKPAEPAYPQSEGYAAAEMARIVVGNPHQVTILALGPLTNVALAMRLEPKFVELVQRIIFMGGIVRGPGNVTAVATANILNDPEAARIVFESGADVTMVGQDVTRHVRIGPSLVKVLRRDEGALTKFIGEITRFYEKAYRKLEPDLPGFPVHDLLVPAYAVQPDLFEVQRLPVTVETTGTATLGMTVADFRPSTKAKPNITVCLKAKGEEILAWYKKVITRS
jgi:inosine-uridine nucleoside N-ribohydrolase